MTISQRRARLRRRLAAAELDAMLVTDLVNVRYLSGFTGSNAALLVRVDDDTPVLATDGRYVTQAAAQAPDAELAIERACAPHLAGLAAGCGVRKLGFESHVVTVDGFTALQRTAEGVELVRAAGMVERLREVKDAGRSRSCGWRARPPMRPCATCWTAAGCGPAAPRKRSAATWNH